ncbi:PBSX family phage terminase large subunit [Mucilaginibacter koreensis]
MFKTSILFKHNYLSRAQVVVNQGGTSSGKTFAIIQVLFCLAIAEEKQVITVVGQDIPNLKAGALRDAQKIYDDEPAIQQQVKSINKTDRLFEFHNGSVIEFKSYDDWQDAKSGKRDYLFVNEANGIPYAVYTELALRTRKRIYIDYNPNAAFWVHDKVLGQPEVQLIISDHRHNPFLPQAQREKIERTRLTDEESWKVYARGLTGKISGLVLSNWVLCDDIPPEATLLACGLDFGYTNDPSACLQVYRMNGELWLHEVLYETYLTNPALSARLQAAGISKNTLIVADSAEPKSIEELRLLGWNITGTDKGSGSINYSIDILKRYRLNVTRSSINLRRELERYCWRTDATGRDMNQPVDHSNHLIDPLRYVALMRLGTRPSLKRTSRMPHHQQQGGHAELNGML